MCSMNIISLGMGLQSTALYYMSSLGELPRADYAIFSDLGAEGKRTYEYLGYLQAWQSKNSGIPLIVCREKNLYSDLLKSSGHRFASIPAYVRNDEGKSGMLRRQCTGEYKIAVVDNCIRDQVYRLPKGARRPRTNVWHGITLDEIERMSIPLEAWKVNCYPFVGYRIDKSGQAMPLDFGLRVARNDLVRWYRDHGLPVPVKSACVFCPYRSDASWAEQKRNARVDFEIAIKVDEAIRDSTSKGINKPVFLHRSLRPLAEVTFNKQDRIEYGECSGNCHI